jgi:hypothetical protein
MASLSEVVRRPWIRQVAVGLFAVYVFVLAAVAISVGASEVTFGATVWGQRTLVLGQSAAIRISPRDPSRRGAFIAGFDAEIRLIPQGGAPRLLAEVKSGATAQSVRLEIPADLPVGKAILEVRLARGEQGDVARADVELVATMPPPPAPTKKKPKSSTDDEPPPPVTVEVRPAGGVLVAELQQRLLVRATDPTGAPVKTELKLQVKGGKLAGLPDTLQTDAYGLAQAWVRPNYHELKLLATPTDGPTQTVELRGRPAQFTADVGPMVVQPSGTLKISVESMHGQGPVHADLWQGGRWIDTGSAMLDDGVARLALAAPAAGSPALLQVYRHFVAPGAARAVLHLWPNADPVAALPMVMAASERRGVDGAWRAALSVGGLPTDKAEAERVAAWLLAGWPDKPPDPPMLVDTGPTLRAAASGYRDRIRGRVIGALTATGVLVVLAIAYVLVFHVVQLERRYQEAGAEEDLPFIRRSRAGWEAAILLATITLAIAGLIMMLDGLRWGVDLGP